LCILAVDICRPATRRETADEAERAKATVMVNDKQNSEPNCASLLSCVRCVRALSACGTLNSISFVTHGARTDNRGNNRLLYQVQYSYQVSTKTDQIMRS
jgi:hypothetical protein